MKQVLWTDRPLVIDYREIARPRDEEALWEQAVYPIGNGRLGCSAFGDPVRERIQFNHDSLWVGNEDNTGGYQPFGDIYVNTGHAEFTDYRRELDIERALQSIHYLAGGVHYAREYFVSYPAQLAVLRFSADQAASLSGVVSMGNVHEIPITAEGETLVMKGDTSKFWWWQLHLQEPKRLIADRQYSSEKNIDLAFEARVRVLHQGGRVRVKNNTVVFEDCDSVTLLLAADTNYVADRKQGWRGEHPHDRVCARISASEKASFDELFEAHLADYRTLFGRLEFELAGTPDGVDALSTPQRLHAYRDAFSKGGSNDRDLEVLLYQYARYLMIASSRSGHGGLPANLQGLWLINKRPSWRCDYHTDINVQMNYWFVDSANLSECYTPLAQWIDSIRDVRKEETRRVLGVVRGWLMRSENGIFGGSTWHFQKGDSAWLCQNLWDHFAYTRDIDYLKRYAYPVMREICEFWIDHLKALPDGTLVAPEGRSPEHGPVGVDGVTYDQSLCWDLFNNTIEATMVLGVDAELRESLVQKRDRLLAPRVGKWGQLQEWMEDIDDPKDDHRHINHLIGVYPGRQIHPDLSPELSAAAQVSLIARRDYDSGHPGWSRVWKACMFARLLDGEAAYGQLAETLATHIYDNFWAVHPPFQIDCNFGFAAGVHEMLVQSHLQENAEAKGGRARLQIIHLLPALPAAWSHGRVKGLRVRGGFEVDVSWEQGGLVRAEVRNVSAGDSRCLVRWGKMSQRLELALGDTSTITGKTGQ